MTIDNSTNVHEILLDLGYVKQSCMSNLNYFVSKKGNQVKLNYENNLISLLDNKGSTIDFSSNFSKEKLSEHAKN